MIIGHRKQQEFLKKIIESTEIPHALLFTGSEKLGKKKIAFEFVSSIFKDNILNHPDFTFVSPETKQIQIKQIRDICWRLSLKPVKAPVSAVIIDQAHLMTREAQNCFLKTLEEPKSKSLLILITEHLRLLLPTIISRCQTVKFYQVKSQEIKKYLKTKKIQGDQVEDLVSISLGRPGMVIEYLDNLEVLEKREKIIKRLTKIIKSPIAVRFNYAKELAENGDFKETLSIWLSYFRKSLLSCSDKFLMTKIKNTLNFIEKTMFFLSTTNINPRLALEVLMMEI